MQRRLVFFGFGLCVAAISPDRLAAGAWTQPKGDTFLSLTGSFLVPDDPETARDATLAGYAEHGLAEGLTVGGALEWKVDRDAGLFGDTASSGDGFGTSVVNAAGFVRMRLHEGAAGDPFSFQFGVIGPLREAAPETGLFAEELAVDARLLYGRGFASGWGNGWFGGEGALRVPLDDGATEIRLDLTLGIRPLPELLVFVQSFGTLGLRNADPGGSDYDELKLAPSIGYDLGAVTVVGGIEQTVAGRNTGYDTRYKLSVWKSF